MRFAKSQGLNPAGNDRHALTRGQKSWLYKVFCVEIQLAAWRNILCAQFLFTNLMSSRGGACVLVFGRCSPLLARS